MNIQESNKLIAEFMGANPFRESIEEDIYSYEMYGFIDCIEDTPEAKHFYYPSEMKFADSWDWLMSAVAHICETGIAGGMLSDLCESLITADIDKSYNAVVYFIEWYNDNFNKS